MFKSIIICRLFYVGLIIQSYSVQAIKNSADDYYKIICGYGYSEPYEALNVLSEAINYIQRMKGLLKD